MQAAVLVGGEGTRLRPLTATTPKAMVPILGRPYLEHLLVYLRRYGVDDVSLALGHQAEPIQDYFGDGSLWGVRLTMAVEPESLGSGGAIKQFERQLTRPFFACNGDVLTNFDLAAMRAQHAQSRAAVSIALMEVDDPSGFGVVALDPTDRITAFVEKPPPAQAPSRWANAGLWLFEPEVLRRIPAGRRSMVERELFPELIAAGERLQGFRGHGFWVDIGTPERYLAAQLELLAEPELRLLPLGQWPGTPYLRALGPRGSGVHGSGGWPGPPRLPFHGRPARPATSMRTGAVSRPPGGDTDAAVSESTAVPTPVVAAGAELRGPVLLGAGAVLEAGAVVVGPAVIGPGARLEAGCRVERSVLWQNCTVAAGAVVRESVLADGVAVGERSVLERVVAGSGAAIAGGARLANERLEPAPREN